MSQFNDTPDDFATVRTTCYACGPVEVDSRDVVLTARPHGSSFAFTCPNCTAVVIRPATETDMRRLLMSDAILVDLTMTAGDPITEAEVTEFGDSIQYVDRLAAFVRPRPDAERPRSAFPGTTVNLRRRVRWL